MDDINKTYNNTVGSDLGAQSGGWQDTTRDVVGPAGRDDEVDSDLVPLEDDALDDLDDDEENSDLTDPMTEDEDDDSDMDDDDEILPPGPGNPEIGDDRGGRIIEDPMMDEEDPADDPDGPAL